MNLLITNEFGKGEFKTTDILPRKGDKIDMFYEPLPTVSMVLLYPTTERLQALGCSLNVDAIITVK